MANEFDSLTPHSPLRSQSTISTNSSRSPLRQLISGKSEGDDRLRIKNAFDLAEYQHPRDLSVSVGDVTKGFGSGALDFVSGTGELLNQAVGVGSGLRDLAQSGSDYLRESMSEDAQEALNRQLFDDSGLAPSSGDVSVWSMKFAQGMGSMAPTMLAGAIASPAGAAAIRASVARTMVNRGASQTVANQVASRTVSMMGTQQKIATGAAGVTGFAGSLGSAANEARKMVMEMPYQELSESSQTFNEAFERINADPSTKNLSFEDRTNLAKEETADYASMLTATSPEAISGALASTVGDTLLFRMIGSRVVGDTVPTGVAKGAGASALSNAAEGGFQTYGTNVALSEAAGLEQDPMEGVTAAALEGGAIGALMGVGPGAISGYRGRRRQTDESQEQADDLTISTPQPHSTAEEQMEANAQSRVERLYEQSWQNMPRPEMQSQSLLKSTETMENVTEPESEQTLSPPIVPIPEWVREDAKTFADQELVQSDTDNRAYEILSEVVSRNVDQGQPDLTIGVAEALEESGITRDEVGQLTPTENWEATAINDILSNRDKVIIEAAEKANSVRTNEILDLLDLGRIGEDTALGELYALAEQGKGVSQEPKSSPGVKSQKILSSLEENKASIKEQNGIVSVTQDQQVEESVPAEELTTAEEQVTAEQVRDQGSPTVAEEQQDQTLQDFDAVSKAVIEASGQRGFLVNQIRDHLTRIQNEVLKGRRLSEVLADDTQGDLAKEEAVDLIKKLNPGIDSPVESRPETSPQGEAITEGEPTILEKAERVIRQTMADNEQAGGKKGSMKGVRSRYRDEGITAKQVNAELKKQGLAPNIGEWEKTTKQKILAESETTQYSESVLVERDQYAQNEMFVDRDEYNNEKEYQAAIDSALNDSIDTAGEVANFDDIQDVSSVADNIRNAQNLGAVIRDEVQARRWLEREFELSSQVQATESTTEQADATPTEDNVNYLTPSQHQELSYLEDQLRSATPFEKPRIQEQINALLSTVQSDEKVDIGDNVTNTTTTKGELVGEFVITRGELEPVRIKINRFKGYIELSNLNREKKVYYKKTDKPDSSSNSGTTFTGYSYNGAKRKANELAEYMLDVAEQARASLTFEPVVEGEATDTKSQVIDFEQKQLESEREQILEGVEAFRRWEVREETEQGATPAIRKAIRDASISLPVGLPGNANDGDLWGAGNRLLNRLNAIDKRLSELNAPVGDQPSLLEDISQKVKDGFAPKNNNDLKTYAKGFFGLGKVSDVTNIQLKQVQEVFETVAMNKRRKEVMTRIRRDSGKDSVKDIFDDLVSEYLSQPNLDVRTRRSSDMQAYSTPAPMSFLANLAAGIDGTTTVYEPTAGNGLLLFTANPSNTFANELDPGRAERLDFSGYNVTQNDATLDPISSGILTGPVDVVIANPPFGKLRDADGKPSKMSFLDGQGKQHKLGEIDHVIAKQSLDAMTPNGKAVLIVGAPKDQGNYKGNQKAFLNYLYQNYNITHHVEIDGNLYKGQGAAWPTQMIVIDGKVDIGTGKFAPIKGKIDRMNSWEDLFYDFAERGLVDAAENDYRWKSSRRRTDSFGDRLGTQKQLDNLRQSEVIPEGRVDGQDGSTSTSRTRVSESESGRGDVDGVAGVSGASDVVLLDPSSDSPSSGGDGVQPESGRRQPTSRADGSQEQSTTNRVLRNDGVVDAVVSKANEFQANYKTASKGYNDEVLTPVNMASYTQQALMKIQEQHGNIDNYVMDKLGYDSIEAVHDAFMGLQADSVALAVNSIEDGRAIIIGDQTGVGKGRQAAGVLRYALQQGRVPVFITQKANLFTDMYDDLVDIGVTSPRPFIMNQTGFIKAGNKKSFELNAKERAKYFDEIQSSGAMPDDFDFLFLTYSQISSDTKGSKKALVKQLAENAVIVLDESHTASGSESNVGSFFQDLVANAAGVTYLSATYAKRPENMMVYNRTDLGLATDNKSELIDAINRGGIGMQTYIAGKMAEAGQMVRRERSFEGISINNYVVEDETGGTAERFDTATQALRAIQSTSRAFASYVKNELADRIQEQSGLDTSIGGNQADKNVNVHSFSSVVHNYIAQLSLGLKAHSVGKRAVEAINNGQKPVIALENTLEGALNDYADQMGLAIGDSISEVTYGDFLNRVLDGVLAYHVKEPGETKPTKVKLSIDDVDNPQVKALYQLAKDSISELSVADIPASPIRCYA